MATLIVKGTTPISEGQRVKALQYIQDNLDDQQLSILFELAKSPTARKALVEKQALITSFLM